MGKVIEFLCSGICTDNRNLVIYNDSDEAL